MSRLEAFAPAVAEPVRVAARRSAVGWESTMLVLLVLLLIVLPLAELAVFIVVAAHVGFLLALAVLFGFSLAGVLVARGQGGSAWRRMRSSVAAGRLPGKEAADGAMVLVGGVLLLIPGFITDLAGVLFLLPPIRALLRRYVPILLIGRPPRRRAARTVDGSSAVTTSVSWGVPEINKPTAEHDKTSTSS